MDKTINIATVFSGIGAPEFAFGNVFNKRKINNLFACEIDRYARISFLANHPNLKDVFYEDIYSLNAKEYRGKLDFLVGGSPCFMAGTKIYTEKGYKPIEKVRVGDMVYTHNKRFKPVLKTGGEKSKEIWIIKARLGDLIPTTAEHPFYARRRNNFGSDPEWIETKDLRIGDYIGIPELLYNYNSKEYMLIDGIFWIEVLDVKNSHRKKEVYNLEVEEDNSYTANSYIVHNCQSYSYAGKRLGVNDPRGALIYEYVRILEETKPKIFIYENVKGFKSIDKGETFSNFLKDLSNAGYHLHHAVLNTKDYGIPQSRARLYIVGFLDKNLYEKFEFMKPYDNGKRLKHFVDEIVDEKYYLSSRAKEAFIKTQDKNIEKGNGFRWGLTDGNDFAKTILTRPGSRLCDNYLISQRARGYNKGGLYKICPTISSSHWQNNNALLLDFGIRKLTPRECLRLQGFPDSFKIEVSDTQMYKQAGNAMSVNVLEMIFRQIKNIL